MPRPTTKLDLINLSQENFQSIFDILTGFSEKEKAKPYFFEHRDKNLRDTLAHLHHWHLLFLNWYKLGMNGEKPNMPEKGYTWKETDKLNQEIWKKYQKESLEEVILLFQKSHFQIMRIVEQHGELELFTKKYYKWTNSTSLASYIISATSSHYHWALKWIKKQKKGLEKSKPL